MASKRKAEPASKSRGGRPQDPVWAHFIQTPLATAGHFAAECLYCEKKWPRGRPQELQVHLAKDCIDVDDDTRRIFVRNILRLYGNDDDIEENNKHQRLDQLNITDFWDKEYNEELSKPRQDSIDQSLTKAFVCCGIPFSVVEHPFFVEMFKKACPGYILPSRDKLSGIMLSHMAVKIEDKIDAILESTTNLTLGKHLLFNF